jgi:hypothetical protein
MRLLQIHGGFDLDLDAQGRGPQAELPEHRAAIAALPSGALRGREARLVVYIRLGHPQGLAALAQRLDRAPEHLVDRAGAALGRGLDPRRAGIETLQHSQYTVDTVLRGSNPALPPVVQGLAVDAGQRRYKWDLVASETDLERKGFICCKHAAFLGHTFPNGKIKAVTYASSVLILTVQSRLYLHHHGDAAFRRTAGRVARLD